MSETLSSGYDKKRFQNCHTEEFDCFICTEVSKQPKQCENCEKIFCSQCINDWFKRQAQCPYRCDIKFRIGQFKNKALERIYNNLNLTCTNCSEIVNIKDIDKHEIQCKMPKCQNFENCNNRISSQNSISPLSKMYICSPECQFFLNILNHSSNQINLYNEINTFMKKNYPNIDEQNGNQIQKQKNSQKNSNQPIKIEQTFQQSNNQVNNKSNKLTWDPNAIGQQIQIINETQILLKEQSYIFRSALTKQKQQEEIKQQTFLIPLVCYRHFSQLSSTKKQV